MSPPVHGGSPFWSLSPEQALGLRAALVIALAAGLTQAVVTGLELGSGPAAYGVVIASVVVRPDFGRWPLPFFVVLLVVAAFCLALGMLLHLAFLGAPQVFVFALVAALMQLLALPLPAKLRPLAGLLPVLGVLPLLSSGPTWQGLGQEWLGIALGLTIGTLVQLVFTPAQRPATAAAEPEPPADPPVGARIQAGLRSPFFWRRLVMASLALAIGNGVGALQPKYLYFGVVLLLDDSIGATLARVRDRMVGVSLGILMPVLVFTNLGLEPVATALVMGGTAALVVALGLQAYLRTALISSAVSFVGYGPLVAWYIPNRWLDYLMGCGLALLTGLLLFPQSALRRYRKLAQDPQANHQALLQLEPAAREEARWLGQGLEPLVR